MTASLVMRGAPADTDFADTYREHHAFAVRLAYLLCGDADRAEDIAADVFVKLYRRLARGPLEHPRAYLRRAIVNQTTSYFRRLGLERRQAARRSGDDRGALPADQAVADRDATLAALEGLPTRMRTALVLRFYEDASEAQIADAMGVSRGTVKATISRGLDRLRAELEPGSGRRPPRGGRRGEGRR